MSVSQILTKFTKYYENSFELEPQESIKMSLPSEFNDIFDSQIHLQEYEAKLFSNKYNYSSENMKFEISRFNNLIHVCGKFFWK